MQLAELKEHLVKKSIKPLYIFTGPEIAIMNIYVNKIAEVSQTTLKRVDSVSAIYNRLQNKTFATSLNCYVIRNDKDYTTQEKVWNSLKNGEIQGGNVIILIYDSLDKRSRFYKENSSLVVEFEKLSETVLAKYIKKEIGLPESYGTDLARICDMDYSRILLECDKLKHLSNVLGMDMKETFQEAMKQKLIYQSPKDVIFAFIDSVCRRQIKLAYQLQQELVEINESPLAILSLLYTNIRSMLLVNSISGGDIPERTGLTAWQVKIAKEKGNAYTISELVRSLRIIREAEKGIKIGNIEQNIAVDYVLINIL